MIFIFILIIIMIMMIIMIIIIIIMDALALFSATSSALAPPASQPSLLVLAAGRLAV
jgi:hypothetical protein